jgi:hypothetical protein
MIRAAILKGSKMTFLMKTRQEAIKKTYGMAKDTKHSKAQSELEEAWKRERDGLKSKLSDRDTIMTATSAKDI